MEGRLLSLSEALPHLIAASVFGKSLCQVWNVSRTRVAFGRCDGSMSAAVACWLVLQEEARGLTSLLTCVGILACFFFTFLSRKTSWKGVKYSHAHAHTHTSTYFV